MEPLQDGREGEERARRDSSHPASLYQGGPAQGAHQVPQDDFLNSVLRVRISIRSRIRGIHMFLGLADPHPDPLVRYMDPDPSIISKNSKKNIDSYCFVTSV